MLDNTIYFRGKWHESQNFRPQKFGAIWYIIIIIITFHMKLFLNIMVNVHIKTHLPYLSITNTWVVATTGRPLPVGNCKYILGGL